MSRNCKGAAGGPCIRWNRDATRSLRGRSSGWHPRYDRCQWDAARAQSVRGSSCRTARRPYVQTRAVHRSGGSRCERPWLSRSSLPLPPPRRRPRGRCPDVERFGPQVGDDGARLRARPTSTATQRDLESLARTERHDAGLQPFGGLVTVLQDAARGAAKPLRRPAGAGAWASPSSPMTRRRSLAGFADARGIEYPLLSDAGSATIRAYDLLNRELDPARAPAEQREMMQRLFGVPYPGTFLLDADGRVRGALLRAGVPGALHRLEHRGASGRSARGDRSEMRCGWRPTTSPRRPGRPTPWSPPATGSRSSWTSRRSRTCTSTRRAVTRTGSSACASTSRAFGCGAHDVAYPGLGDLPLRAARRAGGGLPVAVPPRAGGDDPDEPRDRRPGRRAPDGTVTIEGALEYPGLRPHEVCYIPVEVPLTWTLDWRPLLFQ